MDSLKIALTMIATLLALFTVLPAEFRRKTFHIITGYTFANYYSRAAQCDNRIAILPLSATVIYSVTLGVKKLQFIPNFTKKNDRQSPFSIIAFGIMMTCLPLFNCNQTYAKALICVSAGDGIAGLAQFSRLGSVKLFWNYNKSVFGFLLCLLGSLLGIYLYNKEVDLTTAFIAAMTESVDLEDDNVAVFLMTFLG